MKTLIVIGSCLSMFMSATATADAEEPAGTQEARHTTPRLYPFRETGQNEKWGYIDAKGTIVIEPVYRLALDFVAGRARVSTSEKTGYIDEDGRWVFTLPKDWAGTRPFSEGLAAFSVGDMYEGKWGYLDRDGNIVVQPKYDHIGDFVSGRARVNLGAKWKFPGVRTGGKWGFIDKNGRVVIPIQFDDAGDFCAEQAFVEKQDDWFHIDRQGRKVSGPKHEEARTEKEDLPPEVVRTADGRLMPTNDRDPFRGELARVHIGGTFSVACDGPAQWLGGAWYYVNRQGKILRRVRNDAEGLQFDYGREYR